MGNHDRIRLHKKIGMGAALSLAAVLLPVAGAAPEEADEVTASVPIRWVEAPRSSEVVPGSSQTTVATAGGASMEVVTNGLIPGRTYTLWFAFFNHPEHCLFPPHLPDTTLRCGALDLFNQEADPNFIYGDGLVASGRDDVFSAFIEAGDTPAPCDAWPDDCPDPDDLIAWGHGVLTNPLGAEYQSTLRSHGPEDDDYMPEQITTHNGGCHEDEPYHPCRDEQASGARTQLPLDCLPHEGPECLTSIVTTGTPFVIGQGSGDLPQEPPAVGSARIEVAITARHRGEDQADLPTLIHDGAARGNFTFVHTDPTGRVIAKLKGGIDCLRTTSTTAYATGTIRTGRPTDTGISPRGEPIALTIIDRGTTDLVLFNLPFATGVPITEPCQQGLIPLVIDSGDYIVNH